MRTNRHRIVFTSVRVGVILGILCFGGALLFSAEKQDSVRQGGYVGASECRSCHEKFYQLWATSYHGLAMQPYTESFAEANLKPQLEEIVIGKNRYRAVTDEGPGFVIESGSGKQTKYPILHVLGGKNVYYFLTPLEKGHLQTLPVAYDVHRQQWFDTAASGVRHFPDRPDSAIHWKDRQYTFNTSCYGCHVSQLVKNYDVSTDSYHTQWKEPGINCETCHGPAEEHVRVCTEAGKDNVPDDLKLITVTQRRGFTAHQVDTACSTCHAKMIPLTAEFVPGEDFFQQYDLVTLENPDFYPDGRDLGENYTYTTWRMSPCVKAGKLDCVYCHTSSGRYRFKTTNPNQACVSCHTDRATAKALEEHTHHKPKSGVSECIQCHMPMTDFARMKRSDHSMRPPMPAASLKYQSPNACNLCHSDKDASWADKHVRRWHKEDYQKKTLDAADLIDAARKQKWDRIDKMLEYLQSKDRDEIFANSLVRLLENSSNEKVEPVFVDLLQNDPSPLVRASAANALQFFLNENSLLPLLKATQDPYRLVRIRAAAVVAGVPGEQIPQSYQPSLSKAMDECKAALMARPDDAASNYNLGNFYESQRRFEDAIDSFKTSWKLREDFIPAYVNASMAYNALGKNEQAVESLKTAIQQDPNSVAAHLNLALLYGEMGRYADAENAFRKTFELDPKSAVAAYNLGVLRAQNNTEQAIQWCRKAYELNPANSKYAHTLAYYYVQQNRAEDAIGILQPLADNNTDNPEIYMMLAQVYVQIENFQKAIEICQMAAGNQNFDEQTRGVFRNYVQQLMNR
jgi:tetratricopeptide (TPR) repeat protein/nitrate/TMAO reductase-like tetraheme cytochrome c subunit